MKTIERLVSRKYSKTYTFTQQLRLQLQRIKPNFAE